MTQEEKQLILKDLCARLPYNVKGLHRGQVHTVTNIEPNSINPIINVDGYDAWFPIEMFKPYLRPMSSMTEEEKKEYHIIDDRAYTCPEQYAHIPASDRIDWLNKKMFDYRGLIEKGLAIEAPEGMYN